MSFKINNSNIQPVNYDIKANLSQTVKESFQGNSLKDDKKLFTKIDSLPISEADKNKLKELVSEVKNDSNSGFFKSVNVSSSELSKIQSIANSNPMAKELLSIIEPNLKINSKVTKTHSIEPKSLSFNDKAGDFIKEAKNANKWHTAQFSEYNKKYGEGSFWKDHEYMKKETSKPGGGPKEGLKDKESDWRLAYSSCGPTSLKMCLTAKGIDAPDLTTIRKAMGESKYGATDADNVVSGLKHLSGGKLSPKKIDISSSADNFINTLRNEIKNGKLPIMLSAYISDGAPQSGHYMNVLGVKPNGNIVVADPYSESPTREISFDKFKEAFDYRKSVKSSEANVIISS